MDKKLASIIKYFAVFDYFPSFTEIYTFFPEKISNKRLKTLIKTSKYTVGEYSKSKVKSQKSKVKTSEKKLNNWRFIAYIKLISLFPQIKLVGLSGSISMMNAGEEDDIDLFIITEKKRLFTGRLITLVLAQLLGMRRSRDSETQFLSQWGPLHPKSEKIAFSSSNKNKVCLNLFFNEADLKVPKFKQTLFVGHEVLQMKPIVIKGDIYERFLEANNWVFKLFPNARRVFIIKYPVSSTKNKNKEFLILNTKYSILYTFFNKIETFLKRIQLNLINKHRTTEIITPTQLWFHPDDFEKRLVGLDKATNH